MEIRFHPEQTPVEAGAHVLLLQTDAHTLNLHEGSIIGPALRNKLTGSTVTASAIADGSGTAINLIVPSSTAAGNYAFSAKWLAGVEGQYDLLSDLSVESKATEGPRVTQLLFSNKRKVCKQSELSRLSIFIGGTGLQAIDSGMATPFGTALNMIGASTDHAMTMKLVGNLPPFIGNKQMSLVLRYKILGPTGEVVNGAFVTTQKLTIWGGI